MHLLSLSISSIVVALRSRYSTASRMLQMNPAWALSPSGNNCHSIETHELTLIDPNIYAFARVAVQETSMNNELYQSIDYHWIQSTSH
jgi:hypothetical protein